MPKTAAVVKIADQVWAVTALLHRSQPDREDFTVAEIMARARQERVGHRAGGAHTPSECPTPQRVST